MGSPISMQKLRSFLLITKLERNTRKRLFFTMQNAIMPKKKGGEI